MKVGPNRRPLYFVAIVLCVIFVVSYVGRMSRRAALRAEIGLMEARIEEAIDRQFELEAYRTYVGSDAYVEEVMREEFGMAREGETLMVLVDPPALPTPTPDPELGDGLGEAADDDGSVEELVVDVAVGKPGDEPTWRQWVSIFAGAGR